MSVFTPLQRAQLETFLAPYGLGRLLDFQGIEAGSENSNFFVSLEQGEFVLTLVERGPSDDLPFFIELLDVLHKAELPVPYALRTHSGEALRSLADKPALLQPRLSGRHISQVNAHHCREVGALLGRIHLATCKQRLPRKSDRGLQWMLEQGSVQASRLPAEQALLLSAALSEIEQRQSAVRSLPRANLHGDLFRDNCLFEGAHLSGVIDFYNACEGPMLYDLAITVNDWCSDEQGCLDQQRAGELLAAYAALRPFTRAEAELWPTMLRIACVRFWLSRLIAAEAFAGQDVLIHDPAEFQRRLARRQQIALSLPLAL